MDALNTVFGLLERASPFLLGVIVILAIVYGFTKWADVAKTNAQTGKAVAESRIQSEAVRENERSKLALELEAYRTQQTQDRVAAAALQATTAQVLAEVVTGQKRTGARIEETSIMAGTQLTGARDDIMESIQMFKEFSGIVLGMLLEDPPATRERIKRAMRAFAEGEMKKAQDIADEVVAPVAPDISAAAPDEGKAIA